MTWGIIFAWASLGFLALWGILAMCSYLFEGNK